MPNIILSYTKNLEELNFNTIFFKIHHILSSISNIDDCKSRAVLLENVYIGSGDENTAITELQIILLPGRTLPVKQKIAQQLYSEIFLTEIMPLVEKRKLNCKPTCEIKEVDVYYKVLGDNFTQLSPRAS